MPPDPADPNDLQNPVAQLVRVSSGAVAARMSVAMDQIIKAHGLGFNTPVTVVDFERQTIQTTPAQLLANLCQLLQASNDLQEDHNDMMDELLSRQAPRRQPRKPKKKT